MNSEHSTAIWQTHLRLRLEGFTINQAVQIQSGCTTQAGFVRAKMIIFRCINWGIPQWISLFSCVSDRAMAQLMYGDPSYREFQEGFYLVRYVRMQFTKQREL